MIDQNGLIKFILRCVWLTFALIVWIIALNMFINNTEEYWVANLLALLPIAWPVIKFIGRAFGAGWAVGRNEYDINWEYGTITNRGWKVALFTGIAAIIIVILVGVFILPVYWLWYAFITVRMALILFRRG